MKKATKSTRVKKGKYTTGNNISNTTMTSYIDSGGAFLQKNKRYGAYDVQQDKDVFWRDQYGKVAKRMYRQYIDLGYEPQMVMPRDLKYYPKSGRFRKFKPKIPKAPYVDATTGKVDMKISERSSFKKYLASYSIANVNNLHAYEGLELINQFRPTLESMRGLHNGIKFYFDVNCFMAKYLDDELLTTDQRWVSSRMQQANNPEELAAKITSAIGVIKQKIPELEAKNGSMWRFQKVLTIDLHVGRYKPQSLNGKSFIELPQALKNKYCIVNVQNTDNECFKWAVLSATFNISKDAHRVSKYKKIDHEIDHGLDFSKITYPTPLCEIPKFEKSNDISISVYGCDIKTKLIDPKEIKEANDELNDDYFKDDYFKEINKQWESQKHYQSYCSPYLLQKSSYTSSKSKHIDLLLLENSEGGSHYCWIKNFSRFCGYSKTNGQTRTHYCKHCLQGYTSQAKLDEHFNMGCAEITTVKPVMPKKEKAFVKFENTDKKIKAPFAIYADFECLTKPISKCTKNPAESSTQAYQNHEPSGFTIYIVGTMCKSRKPIEYRGKNCVTKFLEVLKTVEKELVDEVHAGKPMAELTAAEKFEFQDPNATCHFCKKACGDDKVRDHCHLTGHYRGPAHNTCNLEEGKKNTRNYKIPVLFHNLKNYDGHLIIQNVGEHTSKIDVIPQNYEKYISFSFDHFRFLDSAAFLAASLDTLASNLYDGGKGKHKFKHSLKHARKGPIDLLLKKGVFPYDYMKNWDVFEEKQLPPIEDFYSKLNDEPISEDDYKHAQMVWDKFKIKNLGDYQDLYCTTDVLLLADIFENFRDLCLKDYDLDPAHYFTLPGFAWDCMLKLTGVRLDLLTDYDMHMMVEQGIRGGISMISHRYAKANNKYLPDYDPDKESSFITYQDANNLYGWAMNQDLPISDFRWETVTDIDQIIKKYTGSRGCFVKCDIEYPTELHDLHNDYPLAPERVLVGQDMLSPYAKTLQTSLNIGRDTVSKLVPNLKDKVGYVADIRNIEYYISKGLRVTKVHQVVSFKQEKWLKPYIDFNTSKRTKAQNDFEKDFYKLMNNAVFGKTMENLRNRVDIHFVTNNEKWGKHATKKMSTLEKKIASPLYNGHIIYNESLTAIKMNKKAITLNKPIYCGMAILDLSKLHMFRFHYDYIKLKYGDRAQLLMTDTDSLMYHIKCEDFYQDMKTDSDKYDMSNFDCDLTKQFKDNTNKKVVGKFKDEGDGMIWSEMVGLRPKMYSVSLHNGKEKKTGKGIKRAYLKKNVTHADYVRCIQSQKPKDQRQLACFQCIRSKKHQLGSYEINKVGLCCYDNKRYILDDGISSLSYGHYKIA